MDFQDIQLGVEVYKETTSCIIFGRIIGVAQRLNGVKVVMFETKEQNLFISDIEHVRTVQSLYAI